MDNSYCGKQTNHKSVLLHVVKAMLRLQFIKYEQTSNSHCPTDGSDTSERLFQNLLFQKFQFSGKTSHAIYRTLGGIEACYTTYKHEREYESYHLLLHAIHVG
jgi:hypothetical protein